MHDLTSNTQTGFKKYVTMRRRRRYVLWIMLGGIVPCLGLPLVLIAQQFRQDSLDHALIGAVKKLDAPVVTHLLNQGASANARDTDEPSLTLPQLLKRIWLQVQHKTVSSGSEHSALRTLFEVIVSSDKQYALLETSAFDTIASALIQHGASIPKTIWPNGATPLEAAVVLDQPHTIEALLAKGVEVGAKDVAGFTLLDHAVLTPSPAAINVLIAHGAHVNSTDHSGHTPLFWAKIGLTPSPDKDKIIGLLKQHGARLKVKEKESLKYFWRALR